MLFSAADASKLFFIKLKKIKHIKTLRELYSKLLFERFLLT